MVKYCKTCGNELVAGARFCFIDGTDSQEEEIKQMDIDKISTKEKPKRTLGGLFKRQQKQQVAGSTQVKPEDLEEFKLPRPQIYPQPQPQPIPKPIEDVEALKRIEQKLDIIINNHAWLVTSVDNWLQAYPAKKEEEGQEEPKESNTKN